MEVVATRTGAILLYLLSAKLVGKRNMSTTYKCPGCGAEVLVPNKADAMLGPMEELGCNNIEEHDGDKPLVMWEEDD